MILTPDDEPIYFPNIGLEGDALDGCLRRTQAFVESYMGCGRPIEPRLYVENLLVRQPTWQTAPLSDQPEGYYSSVLYTRYHPLLLGVTPRLEVRTVRDSWGRNRVSEWTSVSSDLFEVDPAGRLRVNVYCDEVRFTYTAGIDFTNLDDPAVVEIKAIAGMIAIRLSARADIESSRANDESYLYQDFNDYLRTVLMPLKRYYPRDNG